MKTIKTIEASDLALDYLVAVADGKLNDCEIHHGNIWYGRVSSGFVVYRPTVNWGQGGQIIQEHNISVIKVEDDYKVDAKGYTTNTRIPKWGAVFGQRLSTNMSYNSYGESNTDVYEIEAYKMVYGPTYLIAAMRCYCVSILGHTAHIPKNLYD